MAFVYLSSLHTDLVPIPRRYAMAVSTTIEKNASVFTDASGYLVPATAATAAKFVGVMTSETTTTDALTNTVVTVQEDPLAVYEATTLAATAQAQIGDTFDLSDSVTVDNTASAVGVFKILEVVDASTVRGVFVKNVLTV